MTDSVDFSHVLQVGSAPSTMALPVDILAQFRRWLIEERGFSATTVRTRLSSVEQFDAFTRLRRHSLPRADTQDVKDFLSRYDNPRTRNRTLADLRGFYAWGIEAGVFRTAPTRSVYRVKEPRALPRPLTVEVATAVLKACDPGRARTAASLMLYAGLRVSECARLPWAEVSESTIRVRGKGEKDRAIPTAPLLWHRLERWGREVIREYGDLTDSVFPGVYVYRPINPATIWADVRAAGDRIGVHVTPHVLRHTFLTEAYRATRDPFLVARLAGHASPQTTFRYSEVLSEEARPVVAGFNFG